MATRPRAKITSTELSDLISASADASQRARLATIATLTASVIFFSGSLQAHSSNWMLERLRMAADPDSSYISDKLNLDSLTDKQESRLRESFTEALLRSYVDAYLVEIPFFGIAFDVNDLGVLGGIGLIATVGFRWYSLMRERANLTWCFESARKLGIDHLRQTYRLLAMRQVLTIPPTTSRNRITEIMPVFLTWLPVAVHLFIVCHDIATLGIGLSISPSHGVFVVVAESFLSAILFAVAIGSTFQVIAIQRIWKRHWRSLRDISFESH